MWVVPGRESTMRVSLMSALVAGAVGFAGSAMAAPVYLGNFSGNDCSGGGFSNCYATQSGTNVPTGASPSNSIIKVDNGGGGDTSTKYPSINGSELSVTELAGNVLQILYTP